MIVKTFDQEDVIIVVGVLDQHFFGADRAAFAKTETAEDLKFDHVHENRRPPYDLLACNLQPVDNFIQDAMVSGRVVGSVKPEQLTNVTQFQRRFRIIQVMENFLDILIDALCCIGIKKHVLQ